MPRRHEVGTNDINPTLERLFAELKRQDDPRILGNGAIFDNYPTAKRVARPLARPK